jgi:hypothetical protein
VKRICVFCGSSEGALLLFADEPADLLDRFAAWPAPDVGRAWLDPSRTRPNRPAAS